MVIDKQKLELKLSIYITSNKESENLTLFRI